MITKLTRANFLKAVGAGVAWMALMNTPNSEPAERLSNVQSFRSRPHLSPPTIAVTTQAQGTAPGYIFVAPKEGPGQDGLMILDTRGRLVWFSKGTYARDFKVQHFRGEPVLTWWEGKIVQGHGVGEYAIFDNSYREIARVPAGNNYGADLHEFLITPQGTALLTSYNAVPTNLSRVGGPEHGAVWDCIAQELNIETGEVLFEWHSLEHVALEESYYVLPEDPEKPFDYFHINSIDIDSDGDLLICSRNTCAIYKVGRTTGEVLWQLGGKNSSFELGPGTRTAFQHDARRQKDGTITIFDNGAHPQVHDQSRGIVVELDMNKMRATLLREYTSPERLLATSQGNLQMLPNTNVFIGWGSEPFFSEFSYDGKMLFNAFFRPEHETYRAFRFPWVGQPNEKPAVAAETGSDGKVTLYTSWNGATEVESWQVLAGPDPRTLKPVVSARREGFETAITVRTAEPYIEVQAKDRSGRVLGSSAAVLPC